MARLNSSTAHYSLRSCLCEGPLGVVKGVDNDVDEMWQRLDKKCGDPYNELKPSKRGEDKRFVELVDVLEVVMKTC